MKSSLLFIVLLAIFSGGCRKSNMLHSSTWNSPDYIALQPLDHVDERELAATSNVISNFFKIPVKILPVIQISGRFYNPRLEQYAADSLLSLLEPGDEYPNIHVVGITHLPIYTLKNVPGGPPVSTRLFGMGLQPGDCCIVSDYQFATPDSNVLYRRLKNVILHEMGHNMSLRHCLSEGCLMSAKNGNTQTLDQCGNDYCAECRVKLTK